METKRWGLNIPVDVHARLREIARRESRSITQIILIALDEWSREWEERGQEPIEPGLFLRGLDDDD